MTISNENIKDNQSILKLAIKCMFINAQEEEKISAKLKERTEQDAGFIVMLRELDEEVAKELEKHVKAAIKGKQHPFFVFTYNCEFDTIYYGEIVDTLYASDDSQRCYILHEDYRGHVAYLFAGTPVTSAGFRLNRIKRGKPDTDG